MSNIVTDQSKPAVDSENKPKKSTNLIGIAAAIVAVLAALSSIIKAGGDVVVTAGEQYSRAIATWGKMWGPQPIEMNTGSNSGVSKPVPEQLGSQQLAPGLGPAPGPNCHVFTAFDYSTIPPKTNLSWRCGE